MSRSDSDIYTAMLEAIETGEFKPKTRLVETELAARFGVSRTPVREALSLLESQGVLAYDGKRGLIVAALDSDQLSELYDLREVLEGVAARWAARRASPAEISVLRQMLEDDLERVEKHESIVQSNRLFHRHLHQMSHNRYLNQNLRIMRRSLALLSVSNLSDHERAKNSLVEHEKIVTAIEARDEDAAELAARTHILGSHEMRLLHDLDMDQ